MNQFKLTFSEIIEKLKEFYENEVDSFAYNDNSCTDEDEMNIEWREVAQKGGEGQGDEWYSVKYFPQHDIYIRVDGWYQSHNGTEFDGWECCTEVRPKEVLVTVYN